MCLLVAGELPTIINGAKQMGNTLCISINYRYEKGSAWIPGTPFLVVDGVRLIYGGR
jgi:hypothetical protein